MPAKRENSENFGYVYYTAIERYFLVGNVLFQVYLDFCGATNERLQAFLSFDVENWMSL